MNFSRNARFHMKTRVCLKYFLNDCKLNALWLFTIDSLQLTAFAPQFYKFFYETRLTAFLKLMFDFARNLNVFTAMYWFQFPQIQELADTAIDLVFIQCCLSYWRSLGLLVWIKNYPCDSSTNCRTKEWTNFNDFYTLDKSRF